MRSGMDKKAFSMVEIITVIAIISILVVMVFGVGKNISTKGKELLCESTIEILATAVELYYADDDEGFPFDLDDGEIFGNTEFEAFIGPVLGDDHPVDITVSGTEADWSIGTLYYFLRQNLKSKRITDTINDSMISRKDNNGVILSVEVNSSSDVPMPRFIDPWGNSFIYRHSVGDSFCRITSAGRDGVFGTGDDISNIE